MTRTSWLAEALGEEVDDCVLVVVSPSDYAAVLREIDRGPSLAFRFDLARKAFAHTAAYDAASQIMACNMMDEAALEGVQAFIEKRPPRWNNE